MLNIENPIQILNRKGLKKTNARISLLNYFIKCDFAISADELHNVFKDEFNFATIYRNLLQFEEIGIIHTIANSENKKRYILSDNHLNSLKTHFHFECNICGKNYCLEGNSELTINIPDGFNVKNKEFLLKGICKKCNS